MKKEKRKTKKPGQSFLPGSHSLLFAGILLLTIIGLAFYVNKQSSLFSNKNLYPNSPSITPVNMISSPLQLGNVWDLGAEVYSNPKIDITFSYPKAFVKNEIDTVKENESWRQKYPEIKNDPYGDFFVSFYTPDVSIEARQKENFDHPSYSNNAMRIAVNGYKNSSDASLDEFLKQKYSTPGVDGKTTGYMAMQGNLEKSDIPLKGSYGYEGSAGGENPIKMVFFKYKNMIYVFTLIGGTGTGQMYSPEAEKIFDKIIKDIHLL